MDSKKSFCSFFSGFFSLVDEDGHTWFLFEFIFFQIGGLMFPCEKPAGAAVFTSGFSGLKFPVYIVDTFLF